MNKIIAVVLIACVFLAGCTGVPDQGAVPVQVNACADLACLKAQLSNSCGPANATVVREGVTAFLEVLPRSDDACDVFVQLNDIVLLPNATEENKQALERARPFFNVANMVCRLEKTEGDLLDDPLFFVDNQTLQKCRGVLKDQIDSLRPALLATPTPTPTPLPVYNGTCVAANAVAAPVNGTCTLVSCIPGFYDADGDVENGCESRTPGAPTAAPNATAEPSATVAANATPASTPAPTANATASASPAPTPACALANAVADFSNGSCRIVACNRGWADCDGVFTNGCEMNVLASVSNCGSCTTACPARANSNLYCSNGVCGFACSPNYANCNGNPTDGCEANLASSTTSCGSCTTACPSVDHGTPACTAGVCRFACNPGFGDCNSYSGDGCETLLGSDKDNCGACGHACGVFGSCTNGQCS